MKNNNKKLDTRSEMINSVNNNFNFTVNVVYNKSLGGKCFYSAYTKKNANNLKPVKVYLNVELFKDKILEENKNKAVVYR